MTVLLKSLLNQQDSIINSISNLIENQIKLLEFESLQKVLKVFELSFAFSKIQVQEFYNSFLTVLD